MHNKKNNKIVYIALVLILLISIGYAFLSTVLKINANIALSKIVFNIHFDNVESLTSKATIVEDAHTSNDAKTEISFSVSFDEVGDYYKFSTDIVNESSMPGRLKSLELTGLTDSQKKLIKYKINYTDNKNEVEIGDKIKSNGSKNITIELRYKLDNDITNEDLPDDDIGLDCSLLIEYENEDANDPSRLIMNQISDGVEFVSTSSIDFNQTTSASEHGGLQRLDGTEDDDYSIYFYRGGNDNVHNHIIFADKCWRIIRTTDTGGTKLIYNGVPNAAGQCVDVTGNNTHIGGKSYSSSSWYWDSSNVKVELNTWYSDNLETYQDYLEDTPFCNTDASFNFGDINLDCDLEHTVTVANGRNQYPIGLISSQEGTLCGLSSYPNRTSYPWLCTGVNYWTISGIGPNGMWIVHGAGALDNGSTNNNVSYGFAIRPVISLSNEVTITEGYGSQENPYKVDLI